MTDRARARTAEIASLVAGGETTAAIAARYGITPRRVRAIAAATGNAPARAGRRSTGAITPNTAAGRTALATLVADARAVGLSVPVYLTRARTWMVMERDAADRAAARPEVGDTHSPASGEE